MAKRKSLSKKTRFEVFKRDSFTCQYCGNKAPDHILEVDHIKAVSKGGVNDLMNLITSCFDCNRGKSNKEISDGTVIEKQREQLETLNERRIQLEMLLNWRNGLAEIHLVECNEIEDYINSLTGYLINEAGKTKISKMLKNFGFDKVVEAIDISFEKYFFNTDSSFENFFNKISGIATNQAKPKHLQQISYAIAILKNRIYCDVPEARYYMIKYYEEGYDMEQLIEYCKKVENWKYFLKWIA